MWPAKGTPRCRPFLLAIALRFTPFPRLKPDLGGISQVEESHLGGMSRPPILEFLKRLNSRGPGRWPGQSGKELGSTERFLHSLLEQQATEVSRLSSGVLYNTDQ